VGRAYLGYQLLGIATASCLAGVAELAGAHVKGGWLEWAAVTAVSAALGLALTASGRRS
jgi:hypothetical protein